MFLTAIAHFRAAIDGGRAVLRIELADCLLLQFGKHGARGGKTRLGDKHYSRTGDIDARRCREHPERREEAGEGRNHGFAYAKLAAKRRGVHRAGAASYEQDHVSWVVTALH